MILHLGYEIPEPEVKTMDAESPNFTSEEVRILKNQIRKNRIAIDEHIKRLDLFVNHERIPGHVDFIEKLRKRLFVLMEENDTFRKVLWKHFQQSFLLEKDPSAKSI